MTFGLALIACKSFSRMNTEKMQIVCIIIIGYVTLYNGVQIKMQVLVQ